MEGILFLADIILMLLLCLAIFRAERKTQGGGLGLFACKPDAGQDGDPDEDELRA